MNKLENKNTNHSFENLECLIQAIDNKNKNEVETIINENKKYFIENDIVLEMYNKKLLHYERLQYIIDNCRSYLNISSCLIKKLMETNKKEQLEIIFKYGINFFDDEIIIILLNCYKNKTAISYYDLKQQLDNDKYKIPLELDSEKFDSYDSSFYLFNACEIGNKAMVKFLIEHGADITIKNKEKCTTLFSACESGNEHLVRYLVGPGADINEKDKDDETPIFYACKSGNEHLVKYLEEKGADINIEDNDGYTPIFAACVSGNENLVNYLVEEHEADINKESNDGYTPIFFACKSGNIHLVKYLVECGIDINKQNNDNETPLFYACMNNENEHLVRYLVEHGADINKGDNDGLTPLFYACMNNENEHLVRYLVEHGADINKENINGLTPLFNVCYNGYEKIVKCIIELGGI